MSRQTIAQFLLGFFALPVCALFGLMEGLLFRVGETGRIVSVLIAAAIPIIGALRTKQRVLLSGLTCGGIFSVLAYVVCRGA